MIFVPFRGVRPPTDRDKRGAARAYFRAWARTFPCWRISSFDECGTPILRFGGPDFDFPQESRTDGTDAACAAWWQEGGAK